MLILAASLHSDGTPQGRTEGASCHCALSLLPRATLLQACWFTVTPAADGQASLQVSWGRARQKGPSPGRTLSPIRLGSAHSPSSETLSTRHTAFPAHSIPHFAGYRVFFFLCFVVQPLSRVQLFAHPWTVAGQTPPPMEFPRWEDWSGLPCPFPPFFLWNP